MSFREKINGRMGMAAVAVVILAAAVGLGFAIKQSFQGLDRHEVGQWLYFIDEETRQVSIHPFSHLSPQPNASGKPAVVRACFFSTDGGKSKQLLYLLKYSDAGKKLVEESMARTPKDEIDPSLRLPPEDMLVRAAAGGAWVAESSAAGRGIREQANNLAGEGMRVIECYPKSANDAVPTVQ